MKSAKTQRMQEFLAIVFFIFATVGAVVAVYGIEGLRKNRLFTAELIARSTENGNWFPETLKVAVGQRVDLRIRNIDTVAHGFVLPDLKVAVLEIKAGEVKTVSFVVDRKGRYPFLCTVWCSARHMEMRGELIVE